MISRIIIFGIFLNGYVVTSARSYVLLFNEPINTTNSNIRFKLSENIKTLKSKGITPLLLRQRAEKLFPIYERILEQHNVPQDFKYLSVIESNLNPQATSYVGAKGLWQFMPATARELGMCVNQSYDERVNIISSTKNACIYLRKNKRLLGSWILTAASYNCGLGCIKQSIEKNNTKDYFSMKLNKETSEYIYRILAAKMLFEDYFGKGNEYDDKFRNEQENIDVKNIIIDSIKVEAEQMSYWNNNIKLSEPKLNELGEVILRNTYTQIIDSNTKEIVLTITANNELNGLTLKFDIALDKSQHRLYINKMLNEVDKNYADLTIKAFDKDHEFGLSMPDLEIKYGKYQLEKNFKIKAKLYQYE